VVGIQARNHSEEESFLKRTAYRSSKSLAIRY
jgi:hypothetical protein